MASLDRKTVMTSLSKSLWISLTCGALLTAGCAGAGSPEMSEITQEKTSDVTMATIKPGADLEFSSQIDGDLVVGAYSDIQITIAPSYSSGVLLAKATGTEGLDILASSAELRHDMATGRAIWRVSVRPTDDGLHYLNILATVSGLELQDPTARAFSIAIDPGAKSEPREDVSKPTLVQTDGNNLAVFEADETIIPDE